MARLVTYILVMVAGLFFWALELYLNYKDYVGNSPFDLDEQYQRVFLFQRNLFLLAELAFPALMCIAFLVLLLVKFAAKPVRWALGFVLLLSTEFWAWRSFFFDGQMADIYLQNKNNDPTLVQPKDFVAYMIGFALLLVIVILLRDRPLHEDQDALHARLLRSLRKSEYR